MLVFSVKFIFFKAICTRKAAYIKAGIIHGPAALIFIYTLPRHLRAHERSILKGLPCHYTMSIKQANNPL